VIAADFLVRNARQLITCAGAAPRRGSEQRVLDGMPDGAVASFDGRIVYAGPSASLDEIVQLAPGARVFDASGMSIVPGFVDPHTHAVFAGDRRDELRRRLAGATYAEIAAADGGILSTVAATRAASEADLAAAARTRLDEMLACGTTSCEIKSGYGLTVESELKILRAIATLAAEHPIDIAATFLGAHEVPLEFRHRRGAYVDLVVNEMIPAVAGAGLATACDVFCEEGVFSPVEATTILEAGLRAGLTPRIHADELAESGGSYVAASVGARSADHLIYAPPDAIEAMARAGVTATLLPSASFYLKLGRYAPAREFIAAGVAVALATDVNPGGGFSPSMPFAMTLGCFSMGLTFEESLTAATINAAWSIDRAADVGSLEAGKLMDLVIVDGDPINLIRVGAHSIRAVVKAGRIVHESVTPPRH
jgi:imidazolonepropionase